ncbi:hypothetical protein GTY65_16950 [Streptomyces sp. SID8379]|uniref:hypothetical protein n=1 Tax=unclassified Streptomyces TaxID=2593676 RepID=UPI00131A25F1|nr:MULTISPECIES: hypothetical protein [unclassified Streptomyces]MYW65730.1 hypothetical protein [Streptomyces sp. SID8379]
MPKSINLPCPTCLPHRSQPHKPLTKEQKDWMRQNTDVKYTDDWWKCAVTGCLTARSYTNEGKRVQFPPDIA